MADPDEFTLQDAIDITDWLRKHNALPDEDGFYWARVLPENVRFMLYPPPGRIRAPNKLARRRARKLGRRSF